MTGRETPPGRTTRTRPVAGPWLGRDVAVEVSAVAHGGHCVARPVGDPAGRVVFVRHALPGERVVARVTEDGGGAFCRADAVEILRPAPGRVAPPCGYAGPGGCGGCDWQHADPDIQRGLKGSVVREALARIAGLPAVDVEVAAVPGGPLGWRTRVQFAADPAGRLGLRRHRSHQVQPLEHCPLAAPGVARSGVLDRRWPGDAEVEVIAVGAGDPTVLSTRRRVLRTGPAVRTVQAAGRQWRLSAGAFWQVHPSAADTLAECVRELLRPAPGESGLDLYAGAGLFAGVLATGVGDTGRVLAIEGDRVAAADASANLADLGWVSVHRARVGARVLADLAPRADVVVLDPPRTGAGPEVTAAVCGLAPRAIAYVACDPAALARDVRRAREHGYLLAAVRAFDIFPMTHHVECVALLEPADAAGAG
ncbi:MAG: class I SAM-dependent RNA methyltransferase [Actinobacteria bacterium]|nr:class I SAM-dependent RNA methyltransferase [Actinomycetota bacterium]